jgi:DNA-binding LacI/PurR family transcriptional regulator
MTRRSSSVTIRDVAKQAGVSVATVSRYINRTAAVSPEVAARLNDVMGMLRYVPHATARNLATQKTNAVGLLLTYNIYGDFFAPLLRGIEEVTREARLNLLIASRYPSAHGKIPPALGPHNTDGLLVYVDSLNNAELTHLYDLNFPMVLIHRTSPSRLKIPSVTVENKAAAKGIVDHLIEHHHCKKIIFLRGPENQEDSYWRELGYRASLEAHGIQYKPELILPGDFEREVAHTTILKLVQTGVEFDAVFAGNDEAAVGVLGALRETGKRVPEDIAVIGFDDQNRTIQYLTPPLTTVRAPTEEVGRVAARQLVNLIHHGQVDPLTLLPTEIVIRRSCGCQV